MANDPTPGQEMPHAAQIPHPRERRQPLPGCKPKPSQDDEAAPKAVQKILDCPSYRQADEDLDFLHEPETRGIRLELEYLKAERLLEEHRVAHTIVVFGGSRILERGAAMRQLKETEQLLAKHPQDADLKRKRQIAERVLEKSK